MSEINVQETQIAKRGRPVVGTSARQARLQKRAERLANGGELKRGRPSNPNSARQARLAAKAEAVANGVAIKRGRPKVEKTVELTELSQMFS